MTNMARAGRSSLPIFPKGWPPFVMGIFALYVICVTPVRTVQIAPIPQQGGVGWVLSIIGFGVVGGLIRWKVTQNDRPMRRSGILGFGIAAAMGAGMLYDPVMAIARGMIDFPSASTREYRTLLPILEAHHQEASGKRPEMAWVVLAGYRAEVGIVPGDYRFMERVLRQRSDLIESNARFCAKVTVQKSGNRVRIMNTVLHTLHARSIVFCDPAAPENQPQPVPNPQAGRPALPWSIFKSGQPCGEQPTALKLPSGPLHHVACSTPR